MKKILVIDDTPEVREVIECTLGMNGFKVVTAGDGLTGVQLAHTQRPDLILCDINMPNLDGYDTLAALRQDPLTATIPFVFLSGVADRGHVRKGMELGADDYLTKPFTTTELMSAVTARLEKQEKLQKLTEKKLDELRGNISLALPHELRTPLNGILGLASILMDDHANMAPGVILETARYIHEAALRLNRLIENFLIYAQIELVATDPKKIETLRQTEPLPVRELIQATAREKAELAQREGDLILDVMETNLRISQEHVRKIVEELVDNALKFSEAKKPVRVRGRVENQRLVLLVEDQGRGMTPEQIAKVGAHMQFERKFYEQQGAGLGLFIAKRLTELYGGELTIQSAPGQRTTVKVAFPVRS
jgi:two-component system, sensor histidine kinase and response regulator